MRVPRYSDLPHFTVRQIQELAIELRRAEPGTRYAQQLADRVAAISIYLQDSGALGYLMHFAECEPEAPPEFRAPVIPFPVNHEKKGL